MVISGAHGKATEVRSNIFFWFLRTQISNATELILNSVKKVHSAVSENQ